MTATELFSYSLALFIAAAIPGPGITAVVARALGQGFRTAYPMAFGLMLGDLLYLSAAILGLAYVAQTFGYVFMAIKYAGALYLIYLAWGLWKSGMKIDVGTEKKPLDGFKCFLSGLTLTLGNPKTMLFYLGIAPAVIDLAKVGVPEFAELAIATFLVLLVVITPYMMLAGKARDWLAQPKKMQALNRTAAAFMAGAATMILARG